MTPENLPFQAPFVSPKNIAGKASEDTNLPGGVLSQRRNGWCEHLRMAVRASSEQIFISLGVSILKITLSLMSDVCACPFVSRTRTVHILSLSSFAPSFLPKLSFIHLHIYRTYSCVKAGCL